MEETWECVVVGGGSAGLSAGLVLGRARRRTLLVDAGGQSNLPAEGVGGLLGNDRRPPADLYATGREEIAAHPSVEIRDGEVVDARVETHGFELEMADGSTVSARKLLLAAGMEYRPPDLPGLRELWGGPVFHCPFCHGWEVREGRLGVLASGEGGAQKALLLRAWSDDVTLLTGGEELPPAQLARLESAGVKLEERRVEEMAESEGAAAAVRFGDGSELPLDGLLVTVSMHQRSPLAARLGVTFEPLPLREETIAVDAGSETSVAGVYAAGDVSARMPSVAAAIAAGSLAAARIVHALMEEAAASHAN